MGKPVTTKPRPWGFLAGLRTWWRGLWKPRTLREHLIGFLGRDFHKFPTHEKSFPGYDLASLSRALTSFLTERCSESQQIGGCGALYTLRDLFESVQSFFGRGMRPTALPFQRVPIDVGEEGSFVTNVLYLAVLRPDGGQDSEEPERIAILLAAHMSGYQFHEGFDARTAPLQQIFVSIACRSREVANRFFAQIEERRQRLSIYRGKVIDPVVVPGSIQTIGFRALRPVPAEELVLTDEVRDLLHRSVLSFYSHRDILRQMGVDLKRGLLFHGAPGTGKTSISLYLAGYLPHFTICFISGERLLYPREICRMARYLQPTMLVFEDIDLVAQERNFNGLATVLGELMNQIDGCEPSDQLLFILNTNSLDRLEHAVKNRPGRVDQIIALPLPDRSQRQRLLETFARNLNLKADLQRVVIATEGSTPAMLKEVVKRSVVAAVERHANSPPGTELVVEEADLLLAAEQVRVLRDPEAVPGRLGFREGER